VGGKQKKKLRQEKKSFQSCTDWVGGHISRVRPETVESHVYGKDKENNTKVENHPLVACRQSQEASKRTSQITKQSVGRNRGQIYKGLKSALTQ